MLQTLSIAILIFLGIALLLPFGRIVSGPQLPDRAVALDLMASIFVGMIVVFAIVTRNAIYLDIALVVALLNFLGTLAFGYFLEQNSE